LLFGNQRYNYAVDTWSLGCIFFELAEGRVLFQTESEIGQIMEIMRQQGNPKAEDWQEVTQYSNFRVILTPLSPPFPNSRPKDAPTVTWTPAASTSWKA
jgi:serine/threonine protein kinase